MRWRDRRCVLSAGALAVVGFIGFAHVALGPERTAAAGDTVTYEITGPREAVDIRYGDVVDLVYSPDAATIVDHAMLPWRVTVPATAALSLHDLSARSAAPEATALTCTVRRGAAVMSTHTAVGRVGCDVTPAAGRASG